MAGGETIKQQQKRNEYIAYANKLEKAHGLPDNIIVGLMSAESAFRPEIISGEQKSSAGAIGILQFMPTTAKEYGIDPTKPYQSINAAVKYIKNSYKQLGNWEDSIRSYNAGVGAIKEWKAGKRQLPKETKEYLGRVQKGMGLKPTSSYAYSDPFQQSFQTNNIDTRVEAPIFAPNINLASVPSTPEEDKNTESEAVKQLKEQQAEKNFLQDFYTQQKQQVAQQEQPQVQRVAPIDVLGTYNQVKQFVEQPLTIAQQGKLMPGTPEYGKNQISYIQKGGKKGLENYVDEFLGHPQEGAIYMSELNPDEDPVDNIRHTFAGRYTQDAIAKRLGNGVIGNIAGLAGANLMGAAHELSTIVKDDRPWGVKLKESGEDMFNNAVGTVVGAIPFMDEKDKDKMIYKMSFGNLLPDGYVATEKGKSNNLYFKNQKGQIKRKYQEGGLTPGTPEYEKAYNDYNIFNYNKNSDTYIGRELNPVVVKGKPKPKGFWNEYFNNVAREHAQDGPLGAIVGTTIDAVAGLPQKAMTYAFTGEVQRPSEAMNIKNPAGSFVVDNVLDPMNLIGAGLLTKEKTLSRLENINGANSISDVIGGLKSSSEIMIKRLQTQAKLAKELATKKGVTFNKVTFPFDDFVSKNTKYEDVEQGFTTLDKALDKKINDLNTEEGKRRLINQEQEYLTDFYKDNPYVNEKFIKTKAKNNANFRIEELENIKAFGNRNKEFVYNVGKDKLSTFGIGKPSIDETLIGRDIPNNNAHYSYSDEITKNIVGDRMLPGEITLGRAYKNSIPTADHEINHALQRDRTLVLDTELKKLQPDFKKNLSIDNINDYNYFKYGSDGQESSSFLAELRSRMLEDGFIKDTYDEITPELIEKVKTHYDKNPTKMVNLTSKGLRGTTDTRILDFARPTKENFKLISDSMNKLPALIPVAASVGVASQLEQKQQGGYVPVSSRGVYDYPGQEVIVPTTNGSITMKDVNYPILGTDEYGNKKLMMPGMDYQFPGKIIHELPQLNKYFNGKK